ncbi:ParA family protein (plasmid) [Lichenicola cladoniae]|uniref:ParA family protein n=1 Tax=Lichenicola cladoniae TaxID=1484109 RepID=A0A6M8HXE4_9PROT|nr:ParA family protein [Lichenicola cladoniae]NPD69846.1 ParA family protein [Acetobacteraceae bacterium]QKE92926.1 ParA family protein [Lichenicola cladoniae]
MGKIVLVSSPKGGSGKSVLARHLLVSASQAGLDVLGIDFDRQGTLEKWAQRREVTRATFPDFAVATVKSARLQDWRGGLRLAERAALTIIDTPPSVEDHLPAISMLAEMSDLVIIPAVCTQDDIDSVGPWVEVLKKRNERSVVVLNRANRRTTSFARMRGKLVKIADVCPVEIPQLEDVHVPSSKGLTLLDYSKSRGQEPFEEVWAYVRRQVGL